MNIGLNAPGLSVLVALWVYATTAVLVAVVVACLLTRRVRDD